MDSTNIRQLAEYAESHGAHTKANVLRHFAGEVELHEPVIDAIEAEQERDEYNRTRVEQAIQEADSE